MAKELEKNLPEEEKKTAPAKAGKADKAAKAKAKPAQQKKPKKSIVKYFKDAKSEFKKVVWPTPKQVFNNTVVVLVALVVSGIAIWGLDTLFAFLISLVLNK